METLKKHGNFVLLIIAAVYTVIPTDIIPDVVPVVGWLDDIGVDGLLVFAFIKSYTKKRAQQYVNTNLAKAEAEGNTSVKKIVDVTETVTKDALEASSVSRSDTGKDMEIF